jgi:hypothetical protein
MHSSELLNARPFRTISITNMKHIFEGIYTGYTSNRFEVTFHPRFIVLGSAHELDITLDYDLGKVTEVAIPTN